jgi:hypothetical protein
MTMAKWIRVDPEKFTKLRHEKIRGVDVEVFVSPYDVPLAVGGEYNEKIDKFVIEFKYLSPEEEKIPLKDDPDFSLIVGEKSRRLYGIQIEVKKLDAERVGLRVLVEQVDKAIDRLQSLKPERVGNYKVAKEVISSSGAQLFEPLAT